MSFIEAKFVAETEFLLIPQPGQSADADELYRAGLAYATGHGAPYDLIHAHKWMNLAASRGSLDARLARAELAELMTASQIAEAQRKARAWLMAGMN